MTANVRALGREPGGVGIVGGGLLGLGLAYRLAGEGVPVTVYEASPRLGGLAGTTTLGGVEVDRFYHAVTLDRRPRAARSPRSSACATRCASARSAPASTTTAGSPRCRRRASC